MLTDTLTDRIPSVGLLTIETTKQCLMTNVRDWEIRI